MQYFDSTGSNTAVLEEDVVWEDLTFLAGTNASAGTEFELTRAVWDYAIVKRPSYRVGLSGGFHWLHIRGYIEGTVLTDSRDRVCGRVGECRRTAAQHRSRLHPGPVAALGFPRAIRLVQRRYPPVRRHIHQRVRGLQLSDERLSSASAFNYNFVESRCRRRRRQLARRDRDSLRRPVPLPGRRLVMHLHQS